MSRGQAGRRRHHREVARGTFARRSSGRLRLLHTLFNQKSVANLTLEWHQNTRPTYAETRRNIGSESKASLPLPQSTSETPPKADITQHACPDRDFSYSDYSDYSNRNNQNNRSSLEAKKPEAWSGPVRNSSPPGAAEPLRSLPFYGSAPLRSPPSSQPAWR